MSQAIQTPIAVHSSDLPPPRDRKKAMRSVSPPLSNVSLSRFNYILALGTALVVAFYAWRLAQWKYEVGGWWNLALGRRPPIIQNQDQNQPAWSGSGAKEGEHSVEDRIEQLAVALGIPSKDLAGAIAGAVKNYIPPASLSSVAAHETGDAVKYMVDPTGASSSETEQAPASAASRGFKAVGNAFEAVVGMDEPPSELYQDG